MKCDCTSYCGDDPWLANGKAEPCRKRALAIAAADQLKKDIEMLNELLLELRTKKLGRRQGQYAAPLERVLKMVRR